MSPSEGIPWRLSPGARTCACKLQPSAGRSTQRPAGANVELPTLPIMVNRRQAVAAMRVSLEAGAPCHRQGRGPCHVQGTASRKGDTGLGLFGLGKLVGCAYVS